MRIAVIGAGVSGCLAARLLATRHEVVLFEAGQHAGGHTHTVDVDVGGWTHRVDTGFMVFNERTYPNFCRMLRLLDVPSRLSDMSFSVADPASGFEYQGSSLNGLFAQRANCVRPTFLRMLWDVVRFNQRARAAAADGEIPEHVTVGEFLRQCGVSDRFVRHYLTPMAAAIWSARPAAIHAFPARFLVGFFANHGLLQLRDRPQWRTILGGAKTYVEALLAPLGARVRLNTPIEVVARTPSGVLVTPRRGRTERFDRVVMATHADQTLKLLADVTAAEQDILSAFPYQANKARLHVDKRMLPRRRRAWASWNYRLTRSGDQPATVTYDLSRLQGLATPSPLLLTLNDCEGDAPEGVLREFEYSHPAYTPESSRAQRRLNEINGVDRTYYCGAYWGYGFHEDGVNSALAVAKHFNIPLEACTVACTREGSRTAVSAR